MVSWSASVLFHCVGFDFLLVLFDVLLFGGLVFGFVVVVLF